MKVGYLGREQTYLKHFFLEHYLERVGYIVGGSFGSLVYVDGFSGSWRSAEEDYKDTSFMVAIRKLRDVRRGLEETNRPARIRCLFIEKDQASFAALEREVAKVTDLTVKAVPGEFEDVIPQILDFVGRDFSLTFIDPTGWKGIALHRIAPILQHVPGEVLINYMTDYQTRFGDTTEHARGFLEMMGGPGYEGLDEQRRLSFYCDRVREVGRFEHVTSTRIKHPTKERTYFHLVYGTRHLKGLEEFRSVEEREIQEQERVRLAARDLGRIIRTQTLPLFSSAELDEPRSSFEAEFLERKETAKRRLTELLETREHASYEDVLRLLLEIPLVWQRTVKQLINELKDEGYLRIEGLKERQRAIRKGCVVVRTKS